MYSLTKSATSTSADDVIIYGKELPTHSELWDFPTITMRRSRTSIVPLPLKTEDGLELPFKKRAMDVPTLDVPSLTDDLVLPTSTDDLLPSLTMTNDFPLETDDLNLGLLDERALPIPSVTRQIPIPTVTCSRLPSLTATVSSLLLPSLTISIPKLPVQTDDLDLGLLDERALPIPSVTRQIPIPTVTYSRLPSLTATVSSRLLPSLTISVPKLPVETDDLDLPFDIEEKRAVKKHHHRYTSSSHSRLPSVTVSLSYLPLETDDLDLPLLDTNKEEEKRDVVVMSHHRSTHTHSHLTSSTSRLLPLLPLETAGVADPDLDFAMNKKRADDKLVKPLKPLPSVTKPSVSIPSVRPTASVSGSILPKPSVTAPPHVHDYCSDCGTKCVEGKDVAGLVKCIEKCVAECLAHLPVYTDSDAVDSRVV